MGDKGPRRSGRIRTTQLTNVPLIEQAAAGRGVFSIRPERDGIVRRVPIIMRAQGSLAPSLSIELLRVVTNLDDVALKHQVADVELDGNAVAHHRRRASDRFHAPDRLLRGRRARLRVLTRRSRA